MAKEPEDKHGASDSGGAETPAENNPPQDDTSATPPEQGDEQSELPLDDEPTEDGSTVKFPKPDFPNADWPMMTIFISIPAAGLAVSLVETPSEMLFDGYF